MEVIIPGKNRVVLTQADFKAAGGEGNVYVKGGIAYKVYHDAGNAIPIAKIQELSRLTEADIIKPIDPLLDGKGNVIGYTMRAIPEGMPLIQTFTKAFRVREGLTPDKVEALVGKLRAGVQHVHDHHILIVDLNEMNFLVDQSCKHVYFIDVDSYQTRSFRARVLMESVRDRHCQNHAWDEGTDWFSFAVVSFQMRIGIHPFKGVHPSVKHMNDRMLGNLSVLNPAVDVPAATLPFSVIPANYMDWYKAVFERGMRIAPPVGTTDVIHLTTVFNIKQQIGSNLFDIFEDGVFGTGDIVRVMRGFVLTGEGLYQGTRRLSDATVGAQIAFTPTQAHAVLAWVDHGSLKLYDATLRQEIGCEITAEAMTTVDGRIIFKQGDRIQEVEFTEVGNRIIATSRHIGNVLAQASQVFEGVVLQSLLGAQWASLFPTQFACHQIRLKELEGYRIIDAKFEGRVLIAVGEKKGKYDQMIVRFSSDFVSYDVRTTSDITYTGINFTVLDSGICVHMNPAEHIELFQASHNSPAVREIDDPVVRGDIKLFKSGTQTLFTRGNQLFRISLKRTP